MIFLLAAVLFRCARRLSSAGLSVSWLSELSNGPDASVPAYWLGGPK